MRMHPWDTNPPTEPGLLVPWIAYSPPPLRGIAAAPIGLLGLPPGIVPSNRGRRRPSRLDVFSVDGGRSRPGHASLADTHRIADRLSVADNVIEAPLVRLYDDRARRIAIEADDLPGTGRRGRQDAGDYKRQNTQQNDTHV